MQALIDQTFDFPRLTFCQIKWTVCKSKLRMFWSKLCQSNWINAWNLAFPGFISTISMEYVWKSSLWLGIYQTATQQLLVVSSYWIVVIDRFSYGCDHQQTLCSKPSQLPKINTEHFKSSPLIGFVSNTT